MKAINTDYSPCHMENSILSSIQNRTKPISLVCLLRLCSKEEEQEVSPVWCNYLQDQSRVEIHVCMLQYFLTHAGTCTVLSYLPCQCMAVRGFRILTRSSQLHVIQTPVFKATMDTLYLRIVYIYIFHTIAQLFYSLT